MIQDDFNVGDSFNLFNHQYRIKRKIGGGGYGSIWLIQNGETKFALKKIHKDQIEHFVYTPEYLALVNESEKYLSMNINPYLVTFIAFYREENGNIFAVLEYIKKGSLKNLISKKGIKDLKLVLDLSVHIASGLHYVNINDIIHRDLSPENVLIEEIEFEDSNESMLVGRISDLGLSKLVTTEEINPPNANKEKNRSISDLLSTIGHADYISPEQEIDPSKAGKDSDIFSFGLLLCKMITGKLPSRRRLLELKSSGSIEIVDAILKDHIESFFKV